MKKINNTDNTKIEKYRKTFKNFGLPTIFPDDISLIDLSNEIYDIDAKMQSLFMVLGNVETIDFNNPRSHGFGIAPNSDEIRGTLPIAKKKYKNNLYDFDQTEQTVNQQEKEVQEIENLMMLEQQKSFEESAVKPVVPSNDGSSKKKHHKHKKHKSKKLSSSLLEQDGVIMESSKKKNNNNNVEKVQQQQHDLSVSNFDKQVNELIFEEEQKKQQSFLKNILNEEESIDKNDFLQQHQLSQQQQQQRPLTEPFVNKYFQNNSNTIANADAAIYDEQNNKSNNKFNYSNTTVYDEQNNKSNNKFNYGNATVYDEQNNKSNNNKFNYGNNYEMKQQEPIFNLHEYDNYNNVLATKGMYNNNNNDYEKVIEVPLIVPIPKVQQQQQQSYNNISNLSQIKYAANNNIEEKYLYNNDKFMTKNKKHENNNINDSIDSNDIYEYEKYEREQEQAKREELELYKDYCKTKINGKLIPPPYNVDENSELNDIIYANEQFRIKINTIKGVENIKDTTLLVFGFLTNLNEKFGEPLKLNSNDVKFIDIVGETINELHNPITSLYRKYNRRRGGPTLAPNPISEILMTVGKMILKTHVKNKFGIDFENTQDFVIKNAFKFAGKMNNNENKLSGNNNMQKKKPFSKVYVEEDNDDDDDEEKILKKKSSKNNNNNMQKSKIYVEDEEEEKILKKKSSNDSSYQKTNKNSNSNNNIKLDKKILKFPKLE